MSRLSNIDKSVSVIIPSCNDAEFTRQNAGEIIMFRICLFPEGSRMIRYIKGNAQILQLSLWHISFPRTDVPNGGFAVKPLSDTLRYYAFSTTTCSYCLYLDNIQIPQQDIKPRFICVSRSCVIVQKLSSIQTKLSLVELSSYLDRLKPMYEIPFPILDKLQEASFTIMNYYIRILKPPFLTPTPAL